MQEKNLLFLVGQFKIVLDYANIRSYFETCRLYDANEYECISMLVNGNPYTFNEIIVSNKLKAYFFSVG